MGGIAGITTASTTIINSYNEGEVIAQSTNTAEGKRIGGIAGSSNGKIINCLNKGTLKSLYACERMGGIAGFNSGTNAIMANCYNTGSIIIEDGNGGMIGGLVGRNNSGATIKNCYSTGTYTYPRIGYLGGINGYNYSPSAINNSYYLNITASKAYNGSSANVVNCTSKTEAEMKDDSFITLLDTDNEQSVWTKDSNNINNGYPILKWQL